VFTIADTVPQAPAPPAAGCAPCTAGHVAGVAAVLRLSQIEPPVLRITNHLLGHAAVSQLALPGQALTWRWRPAPPEHAPALTLSCAAADVRCALSFDADEGPGLDGRIDLEAFTGPALLAAAAVRYAAVLAHLARLSGRCFECTALRRGAGSADAHVLPQALVLGFVLSDEADAAGAAQAPRALTGTLQVLPSHAAFWRALHGGAAPLPAAVAQMPVAAQLRLAQRLTLRAEALRRLRVGGALLLGSTQAEGLGCRLQWPGRMPAWSAVLNGSTLRLHAPVTTTTDLVFAATTRSSMMDSMPAGTDGEAADASAAIDTMPIVLHFHVGEVSMPLSALPAVLTPGYVIELGRPLDTGAVSVRANGRLLADGELIQVGGQLAVRISRLVGSAGSANSDGSV
jgi:flagellar motor switch/type III secretory pathway protein FliN